MTPITSPRLSRRAAVRSLGAAVAASTAMVACREPWARAADRPPIGDGRDQIADLEDPAKREAFAKEIAAARRSSTFPPAKPIVVSTWRHGVPANEAAIATLKAGGSALDAAEAGVMVTERDPENLSVGLAGLPDRDGLVTLDAAIMDHDGRAGGVCFVQGVRHPIALARRVMEKTPHVLLAGAGAERFAREEGFEIVANELSPAARERYEAWLVESRYEPVANIENQSGGGSPPARLRGGPDDHDTIGMLVLDADGRLAASCTTSGLGFKMHGRVGDSPIVGAGIYVDGEVGAATCTGLGETVLKTLASFLAVERMRAGDTPQQACEAAIGRVIAKNPDPKSYQVGILAIDRNGSCGAFAVQKGFDFARSTLEETALVDAPWAV
jgi:N4-(beta-N-acetylglucosaminyl)-L-asparaginase